MYERSAPQQLRTPLGNVDFNPAAGGDGFYLTDETTGFDEPELRVPVEDAAQTDGALLYDGKTGAWHPVVVAEYLIDTGDIADRNAAIDDLRAKLRSILAADGEWAITATGQPERTLTVRYEQKLVSSGGAQLKRVIFGLVSPDVDWS